jgi:hypothetical protein
MELSDICQPHQEPMQSNQPYVLHTAQQARQGSPWCPMHQQQQHQQQPPAGTQA